MLFSKVLPVIVLATIAGAMPVEIVQKRATQVSKGEQCPADGPSENANPQCDALFALTNTLYQTSNNLAQGAGESVIDVNEIIQEIIPSTNPVSSLAQSLTAGFTSGTVYAVSNFLYGVANAINDSPTDCGCQLGPCGNAIAEANRETSAGDYGAQSSCNEARKTCGAYYSSAQINQMASGCKKYPAISSSA